MTTVADDLRKARELIADPKTWVTGCTAKREDGRDVLPCDDGAIGWCAVGALCRAIVADFLSEARESPAGYFLFRSADELFNRSPYTVNDAPNLGHAAVLRMYDRAIELASEDSQP